MNAELTWEAQRPLSQLFDLVMPNRRGFSPGEPIERVDFEDEAAWLGSLLAPGTHLVGHSYGAVIALLAAAAQAERVQSLTVVEPPIFGLAAGHAEVDAYVAEGETLWASGPRDPEAFLRAFLRWVDGTIPPLRLPPALLQGARLLQVERPPWQATVPFDALATAPFPLLVVSGAHGKAYEMVCDVIAAHTGAARATLPGAGHSVQLLGRPFNELLTAFVTDAEARRIAPDRNGGG